MPHESARSGAGLPVSLMGNGRFLRVGLIVAACAAFLALAAYRAEKSTGGDFSSYWLSAWWMRERPAQLPLYYPEESPGIANSRIWTMIRHGAGYSYEPWQNWGKRHDFRHPKFYLYPPPFAIAFVPLTYLPLHWAARLWGVLNAAAMLAALALVVRRTAPPEWRAWIAFLVAGAAAAFWQPGAWGTELGQNSPMLFLLWMTLPGLLLARRDTAAGLVLGALILVKLSPVVIVPWLLWRGHRKVVLAAAITVPLLLLAGLPFTGFDEVRTYFLRIVPLLSRGTAFFGNQSLLGVALRLTGRYDAILAEPGSLHGVMQAAYLAAACALLAVQCLAMRRRGPASEYRLLREFGAWTLFLLLINSVSWVHHHVSAAFPLALALAGGTRACGRGRERVARVALVCACGALMGAPFLPSPWIGAHSRSLWISLPFFGTLALWAYFQMALFGGDRREAA